MPIDRSKVNENQSFPFLAGQALSTVTWDGNGWILQKRHDAILKKKTLDVTLYR